MISDEIKVIQALLDYPDLQKYVGNILYHEATKSLASLREAEPLIRKDERGKVADSMEKGGWWNADGHAAVKQLAKQLREKDNGG